jgi:DNA mismatch repair protein MutS
MTFSADKQTAADLNLLGRFRAGSIQAMFGTVVTAGAERVLDAMFAHPLGDPAAINARSAIFRYFQQRALKFPFQRDAIGLAEDYLRSHATSNVAASAFRVGRLKLMASVLKDEQYGRMYEGFKATVEVLATLENFLASIGLPMVESARAILRDKRLGWVAGMREQRPLSWLGLARMDRLLRGVLREEVQSLLELIHLLDVYIAVSAVAQERKLSYAEALDAGECTLTATALWHPGVRNAVANPLSLNGNLNALFLTGANMAGKSTLMKSLGIAVYLAHMGFPVAARELRFSVLDGLYSSINVADSLDQGYSHFYAEVMRVKNVAQEVASGRRLLVIFDELFKGTNVKDASDATLAVITAFSQYRHCFFVVSTHIVEVGEAHKPHGNFRFLYLPTVMDGKVPRYPYLLAEGISSDRQGMMIIENEGILEMLMAESSS